MVVGGGRVTGWAEMRGDGCLKGWGGLTGLYKIGTGVLKRQVTDRARRED